MKHIKVPLSTMPKIPKGVPQSGVPKMPGAKSGVPKIKGK